VGERVRKAGRMSPKCEMAMKDGIPGTGRNRLGRCLLMAGLMVLVSPGCERGPAPLGDRLPEARSRFEKICSGCHPVDVPLRRRKSLKGWRETVGEMRAKGASLTDQEAEEVARYLAQTRGL